MADRWLARIKRHENAMEARLADELQTLAMLAATVYSQYARTRTDDGRLIIEDTASNRAVVKDAVWNRVVAPYFGVKDNQLDGTTPRTPFMRLIVEGIEGAVRIQVERQVALIEQIAPTDVVQFLTGNRAPQLVGSRGVDRAGGHHGMTPFTGSLTRTATPCRTKDGGCRRRRGRRLTRY